MVTLAFEHFWNRGEKIAATNLDNLYSNGELVVKIVFV